MYSASKNFSLSHLFLKQGVLYRRGLVNGHQVEQLLAPRAFHELIFTGLHEEAGHQGRDRTSSLVRSRFFWPGLDAYVERRVRDCERCILRKTTGRRAANLVPIVSTHPSILSVYTFLLMTCALVVLRRY